VQDKRRDEDGKGKARVAQKDYQEFLQEIAARQIAKV
jgi:hypothetical protein